jgi:hypothetical protein
MRKLIPLALVAMIGAVPATLSAQAATAQAQIDAALDRVQQAGIPADLVQMKVREGQAKGVPSDRIATAATHRAAALIRAQNALNRAGVQPTRDDLAAGADALGSGVSEAVLEALAGVTPGEHRAVAIAVLGALYGEGVLPAQAFARVQAAMERGPEALANLPAQAAAARGGQGGPPSQAGQGQRGQPDGVPAPGQRPTTGGRPGATPPTGGPPGGF